MAISIISVSLYSLEESVGTSTIRVILFGTILTTIPDTTLSMTPFATHIDTTPKPIVSFTIPPSPDYTPTSPDYTPALPDYSPTSDTETDPSEDLSSDHIPPLPATLPFLSSTNDSSGSDIPDTTPSPTHDHFDLDDSSRDSSSSSSPSSPSETSSDPSLDDLSDSSSDHSLPVPSSGIRPSHHLCLLVQSIPRLYDVIIDRPSHDSSSVSPSRKRSRSPATSVPLSSPIPGSLSYACANFSPSPKRIWSSEFAIELEAEINECIGYANALRDRGIDARVVVEAVDREEIKTGARGSVEVRVDRVTHPVISDDILEPTQEEGAVEVTYETLGDLVQRFHDHTIEILAHRVQPIKGIQRDQGHRIIATGQHRTNIKMPNTRSGATMTHEVVNEQINRRLVGALGACNATRNLEPLMGNGENGNEGNGGNGNGGYNFGGFMPAREMVPNEKDKVKRFVRGLPHNIHWNVIAAEPTKLQDAICIANNLMDQKLKGYARSAENKRRTMEIRLETRTGTRLETRLEAMKLQQRLMPLEEEE
nr:hypothetical protein [Tanacetum cinerariifolium]